MSNIYNSSGPVEDMQYIFDAFNILMASPDRKILFKLFTRFRLYELIRHLHGDIVECGVFKGSGMLLWLKMCDMDAPHDIRKVVGFDYFEPTFVANLSTTDKDSMSAVFNRCQTSENVISEDAIRALITKAGFTSSKFELVKGDLVHTSASFIAIRPGFRISLLYMDVDLEEPTYAALVNLWDRVVIGGIVVFDEYAYHTWSEANAVDRFVHERGLTLIKLDVSSPTAFVVKQ